MRLIAVMAGLGAASIAAAGAARADTYIKATYRGTITELIDKDARLGTEIDVLTASNLAFENTFVFRLEGGDRITGQVAGHNADNLLGGSAFFGFAPLISSHLVIAGVGFDFGGGYISQEYTEEGDNISSTAEAFTAGNGVAFNSIGIQTDAPSLLTTPYSGVATSHERSSGSAFICAPNANFCADERFDAWFSPDTVRVTVSNAIPEPSTWALAIMGFGLAGGALRRRSARAGMI